MTPAAADVLWTGKPKQGLVLTPRDALMIPLSLAWCGFAVFWTITATGNHAPTFFTLWGLMFVSVGLYVVFGRFIHDAMNRKGIVYTVTRSGITITMGGTETVIPAGQWACLELTRHPDRTGTIRFAPQGSMFNGQSFGMWVPTLEKTPQFYRIEDPERVLELIRGISA